MSGVDAARARTTNREEALPGRTPGRRAFGAALARAGARRLSTGPALAAPRSALAGPGAPLALRRRQAEDALAMLVRRRGEADLEPGVPSRFVMIEAAAGEARGPSPPQALAPSTTLDRAALDLARAGGRTAVALALAGGVRLRLVSARGGVELSIEAPRTLAAAARTELPALVRALQARGVEVASASVLEGGTSGAAPGRALTPPRGSATTARGQAPAGTVAKW